MTVTYVCYGWRASDRRARSKRIVLRLVALVPVVTDHLRLLLERDVRVQSHIGHTKSHLVEHAIQSQRAFLLVWKQRGKGSSK